MGQAIINTLEHAGYVAVAAGLTYLSQWAGHTNFGVWTPAVVAGLSVLTALVSKLGQSVGGSGGSAGS